MEHILEIQQQGLAFDEQGVARIKVAMKGPRLQARTREVDGVV